MFNLCVNEIEYLMHTSILNSFYLSETFQLVARQRGIYRNSDINNIKQQPLNQCETKNDFFDSHSTVNWTDKNKFLLSANGYSVGSHEWTIKILKSNHMRQEIGIVSNYNTKIEMNECGLNDTPEFAARAIYGYNDLNNSFYYSSYNTDNKLRCNKNLSQLKIHRNGHWCKGDEIKICLNGKQVRKAVSIATNTTYYPIIVSPVNVNMHFWKYSIGFLHEESIETI